jgi:hypothetical protein
MTDGTRRIDWTAETERAERMTDEALRYAIEDALDTLGPADGLDRADGGNRGGFYRDQISVYRAEVKKRAQARGR